MKMRDLVILFFLCFLAGGCTANNIEKRPYIDEVGTMGRVMRSVDEAKNSANWKKFDSAQKITFCIEDEVMGCTKDRIYLVIKYLPKKYLGYRYIVFKNDRGAEEIFSVDNLRKIEELKKLEAELERIDP